MKDRVVEFPNRIQLTVVDAENNIYDVERVPGTITEEGTKLNKATFLQDTTASKFGLGGTATPNDVFDKIADNGLLEIGDVKLSLRTQGADFVECNGQNIPYSVDYDGLIPAFKGGNKTFSSEYFHPTYDGEYLVYVDISSKKIYTYRISDGDEDFFDLTNDSFWDNNTIDFGDADRVGNNWYIFGVYKNAETTYMQMLKVSDLSDIDSAETETFSDISVQYFDTQLLRYNGTTGFELYYEKYENPKYKEYREIFALDLTKTNEVYISSGLTSKQRYYNWTHCNGKCYFNEDVSTPYYEVELEGKVVREKMLSATGGDFYVDGVLKYSDVKTLTKIGTHYYVVRASSVIKTDDFVTFTEVSNDTSYWKANFTEPFGTDLKYVASDKSLCNTDLMKIPTIAYGWLKIN